MNTMDAGGGTLPHTINPNNFPAKLWRLANDPAYEAICWDSDGTGIVVDRHLLQTEVLSEDDAFKNAKYQSFVRQLHMYGFRRSVAYDYQTANHWNFLNPNFKRNHPELVVNLRRHRASIRTKMRAGQEVCQRPLNDVAVTTDPVSLLSPPRQDSAPPYYPNQLQHTTPYNGTPVPPPHIGRRCGAPLSPSVFVSDHGIPASLCHNYSDVFLSPNAWHSQQGSLVHAYPGKPNFLICTPPNVQRQPGQSSTAVELLQPNFMLSHGPLYVPQAVQASPLLYYQASYSGNKESQEAKKCNINPEVFSPVGDKAMPPLPTSRLPRAVTPDKPGPVLMPSYNTCSAMLQGNTAIPMNANPPCPQPIPMAVSNNAYVVRRRQEEEFMLPVSEQMPDNAIIPDIVMMEKSLRD